LRIEGESDTRAINFCCVWDLYFDEAVSFAKEIFSDVIYGACVFRVIDAADRSVERENPNFFSIGPRAARRTRH
jgi:hypothetical protein